ncbi:MAG TPA: phosphotransferase [Sporichthyaceae bacterium]|jgi:hypothetical protein
MQILAPAVPADRLRSWCQEQLGADVVTEVLRAGHLATVVGLALTDGREVVLKVRPAAPRLAGCLAVQHQVATAGFPCPLPLAGLLDLDGYAVTVEQFVPGGTAHPDTGRAAAPFAHALARLVELGPQCAPDALAGPAPWNNWHHDGFGLWPAADDLTEDLNRVESPDWVDRAAAAARDRLRGYDAPRIVTHGDWYAGNLRWLDDDLLVAHDWDSVIADTEAAAVGFAAAAYPAEGPGEECTIAETEEFLDAYAKARGEDLTATELEAAWAAGVWLRAFDAKKQAARRVAIISLSRDEAAARLRRAGV